MQSYDPPLAKVTDFKCIIAKKTTLYDRLGTIPYLAPEQREQQSHGCQIDYWACALVGIEILGYRRASAEQLDEKRLDMIQNWLGEKPYRPLRICCKAMLQWEPEDRMTADKAL